MACGTGKTLVAIRLIEQMLPKGGICVYLMPSISLIPQTLTSFQQNSELKSKHDYYAVCSDPSAGKNANSDLDVGNINDIDIPSSTDSEKLKERLNNRDENKIFTIFCVYNSWEVLQDAGVNADLALYDEAHRTAGSIDGFAGKALSEIKSLKKVFMTATPRIYKDPAGRKTEVYSMDDESVYGKTAYYLSFTEAVAKKLLVPYNILVPEVSKVEESSDVETLAGKEKLRSLWTGITKPLEDNEQNKLLQRVIVFHNTIYASQTFTKYKDKIKGKKTSRSKGYPVPFKDIIPKDSKMAIVKHVDSNMSAKKRKHKIDWLQESVDENECRILSNARCLQEGVDVPALDAVAFLDPKKSPVDIIQAVGRVMRKDNAENSSKNIGYVILPVPIPLGSIPKDKLYSNDTYKIVSNVLHSMLAHDDQLTSLLNQTWLPNRNKKGKWKITKKLEKYIEKIMPNADENTMEVIRSIMIKMVDKSYYPRYGEKLGKAANKLEEQVNKQVSNEKKKKLFDEFHDGLKNLINDSITESDAKKVLCQHIVLHKVFDMLFPESKIYNSVSVELEHIVAKMDFKLPDLADTYNSIRRELGQMAGQKEIIQEFIKVLYDSFFKGADPKAAAKYGIVYTPIEIVDFILRSVNDLLQENFDGETFDSPDLKVLDPFAGTGVFITRLLQSGMISKDNVQNKYENDLYANEIMLLAYYTAVANMEMVFKEETNIHKSFPNMHYADTFRQNASNVTKNLEDWFPDMHDKLKENNKVDLRVIIGNPPYSIGQKKASDGIKRTVHEMLEKRISDTYHIEAKNIGFDGAMPGLKNLYLKAFRWASDRIGKSGIIGFVVPSSFITAVSLCGVRACFEKEFTDVYLFNCLGEKGVDCNGRNIFEYIGQDGGSTVGICIVFLVKNIKQGNQQTKIHYSQFDVTQPTEITPSKNWYAAEKRETISKLQFKKIDWSNISLNKYKDWMNQRLEHIEKDWNLGISIGNKRDKNVNNTIFDTYSNGLKTHRDDWIYDVSKEELQKRMEMSIEYCNTKYNKDHKKDITKVAHTDKFDKKLKTLKPIKFDESLIKSALYRPFIKQYVYFDPTLFIECPNSIPEYFPDNNVNQIMQISDKNNKEFSTIITDKIPDLNILGASQSVPVRGGGN